MESAEPPHTFLLLIALILLFLLSMFFSSAETAFLCLNKLRIRFLQEQKHKAAIYTARILKNKQKFLSTILVGNSVVNIAISALLTTAALAVFGSSGLAIAVSTGTILVLIFGEIVPKSIALAYPDVLALAFARITVAVMQLLSPAVSFFSVITCILLKLCGITLKSTAATVTEDDLRDFFQSRQESGLIDTNERQLLNKILHYGDILTRSIMTPRRNIIAIPTTATLEEIIQLAQNSGFSRFPVYNTNIDTIIGLFYLKDYLYLGECSNTPSAFSIEPYLHKPLFVFESTKLTQLEKKFSNEKQTIAIVLDEYGGTAGVVTIEDLREELFGAITDEYDIEDKKHTYAEPKALQDITVFPALIEGDTRITDINEHFSLHIHSHYSDTIAGFLMETADTIPAIGYCVEIDPYTFAVHHIDANRITAVKISIS